MSEIKYNKALQIIAKQLVSNIYLTKVVSCTFSDTETPVVMYAKNLDATLDEEGKEIMELLINVMIKNSKGIFVVFKAPKDYSMISKIILDKENNENTTKRYRFFYLWETINECLMFLKINQLLFLYITLMIFISLTKN